MRFFETHRYVTRLVKDEGGGRTGEILAESALVAGVIGIPNVRLEADRG